jgi:hypothetical protein
MYSQLYEFDLSSKDNLKHYPSVFSQKNDTFAKI